MRARYRLAWTVGLGLGLGCNACGGNEKLAHPDQAPGGASSGTGASVGGAAATTSGNAGASSSGTAGTSALPAPEEHRYTADDPRIQYMGRMDWTDAKAPRFAASAAQLRVKFVGTGASVGIVDQHRYGQSKNYFEVLVDGVAVMKLTAMEDQSVYEVAKDLPNGEHTLVIAKRTEPSVGFASFTGLTIMGTLLDPPALPERKVEFIGDSISCGAGNEAENGSPQCSEDGWGQPYHNGYLAFGPVMARALNTQYHVTAVSGIGLIRNYSSKYDARPMPEVYDLLYPEEMASAKYDTGRFVPDAVVVTLGTNDFSPGDSTREAMTTERYVAAYIEFVKRLRGLYPQAHIFGVSSPMLGDGWPEPTSKSASDLKSALATMAEHFRAAGDDKVHTFNVTKLSGAGCGTHPSAAQHASLAKELGDFVKGTLGW